MANDTHITITGNLTADPELRFSDDKDKRPYATFSIATTPRRFNADSGEWVDGTPMFLNSSVGGMQSQNLVESLAKGDRVVATGRLSASVGKNADGEEQTYINFMVEEIGASVLFAEVTVEKNKPVAKAKAKGRARR